MPDIMKINKLILPVSMAFAMLFGVSCSKQEMNINPAQPQHADLGKQASELIKKASPGLYHQLVSKNNRSPIEVHIIKGIFVDLPEGPDGNCGPGEPDCYTCMMITNDLCLIEVVGSGAPICYDVIEDVETGSISYTDDIASINNQDFTTNEHWFIPNIENPTARRLQSIVLTQTEAGISGQNIYY